MDLFSDDARRNPYPLYAQLRATRPVLQEPRSGLWMAFDYASVWRLLTDHETFSSRHGPDWMTFQDPPRHTKLRALVSRAFTPRSVAALEPRIAAIARDLLDRALARDAGAMDLALDFAVPLPMTVIAEMLGIPPADRPRFVRWNDVLLRMSYTVGRGGPERRAGATAEFIASTAEMGEYLGVLLDERRADAAGRPPDAAPAGRSGRGAADAPGDPRLLPAPAPGRQRDDHEPDQQRDPLLHRAPRPARPGAGTLDLLPSAVEEVLRFRSPLQWMYRLTRREVELHGQTIPAGKLVLTMFGSANRDPLQFPDPDRFDVTRDPNPHLAFGHGPHFCLGAPLARLEGRIALTELLTRLHDIEPASTEPWQPREGLHVHGPRACRSGSARARAARRELREGERRRCRGAEVP